VRTLDNHTDVVRDLAVRPGDHALAMIASAGADRTLRFWQPEIGRLVRFARLPGEPLAIAWTGGGERLVVACTDGHMRVIDPDTLEIVLDQLAVEGWAYEVAVAPDGRAAAVAGSGGQIRRLELDSW
jgi:WD40 repeat protein